VRLDVAPSGYDSAADALFGGNRVAATAYTSLTGKLGGLGAMAGDDTTSGEFASTYDEAARDTVGACGDLVNALATLGSLTSASGDNHRRANADSVYKKPPPVYDGTGGMPAEGPVDVEDFAPPTSLGGDNEDMPEFWNLVVDHLQGYGWPNADTGKLREAATAWRSMGTSVSHLTGQCDSAVYMLEGQRSPEIPLARSAINDVRTQITGISEQCNDLAQACEDYATQVESTRETIKGLLRDLAIEIGATAVVSGIASFFTFGGAAAVGAGVAVSRAISCASKIIKVLAALKAIRAIGTMARTLPKIRGIRTALAKFRNVSAARNASKGINGQLWSGGRWTGRFRANQKNALKHFNKHKDEFPEFANSKQYVEGAKRFMTDPPPGTYTRIRESDGAILRYNPDTNTLGIMSKDGVMNTMFKPDPAKHRFPNNWEYFLNG